MSKRLLVKQCSPTMAGLKTGNLFTCEAKSRPDLVRFVRAINRKFAYKGLKMAIMRYSSGRALIYMYRPAKLRKDFECELVKTILAKEGYPVEDSERCIIELMKRTFPRIPSGRREGIHRKRSEASQVRRHMESLRQRGRSKKKIRSV